MTLKVLTPESLAHYDQTKGYLNKEAADSLYIPKDTFAISATKSGSVTTLTLKDESGTHTTTINDGAKGDRGLQGEKGDPGADGFTPTITSSKSGSVTTLTITNKSGTSTATINDGAKGNAGSDGFTPTVSASKSGTVTTLTITNKTGTTTATINDGAKGDKGNTGSTGPKGTTFTPSVSSAGVISWTNDGGLTNPSNVNIKGPAGTNGTNGTNATINGVSTLTINGGTEVTATQSGSTLTLGLGTSGVKAGAYGPFVSGYCWIPNNRGIKSTTATWTLVAKKAGLMRFDYIGGGEEAYDFLKVTQNDTEILNTKNVASPYGGHVEVTLASGDTIVFTHSEDSSNFYDGDYAAIGNFTLGNTNSNFEAITSLNIDTYFTVTNGTYTFVPGMAFTSVSTTVDSKGRITKATNSYPTLFSMADWQAATMPYISQTTTTNLLPGHFYYLGSKTSAFSYTLSGGVNGSIWHFAFTCGSTAVQITHPSGVNVGNFSVTKSALNEICIMQINGNKYLVGKGY